LSYSMIGPFDSVCVRECVCESEIVCVCEVGSLALHILLSDMSIYDISLLSDTVVSGIHAGYPREVGR
jgi:hypothetical protein